MYVISPKKPKQIHTDILLTKHFSRLVAKKCLNSENLSFRKKSALASLSHVHVRDIYYYDVMLLSEKGRKLCAKKKKVIKI